MSRSITYQPEGATPLDDISGLLQSGIRTRGELDAAEALNIVNAFDWIDRGRIEDVFTVTFYRELHRRMFDTVWSWAGGTRTTMKNIGPGAAVVMMRLGEVAMVYSREWAVQTEILPFIARYHHALVWLHPFENGNGRWSRLACDAVVQRLRKEAPLTWAKDTLSKDSDERKRYMGALKSADRGDMTPLIGYLVNLNPGR